MFIFGITGAQHRFHLVSLSLVSHEHTSAYMHLFTALKETHMEENSYELNPLFMIADGYAAITTTMRMAFLGCPRWMC